MFFEGRVDLLDYASGVLSKRRERGGQGADSRGGLSPRSIVRDDGLGVICSLGLANSA